MLEALAVALRHGKLQQVLFETSNDLRQRLGAARVAIGLADEATVKVKAFSEAATFESRMPIVKAYAAAMEEAYDGNGPIHVAAAPAGEGQGAAEGDAAVARHPAHRALLAEAGASAVLSCPLLHGLRCIGVLTLEKADGQDFGPADHAWLQAFAALFAAVIEQRRAAERSSLRRLAHECRKGLAALMGPRHLVWKAAIALAALTVAILLLVEIDYRVSAKTVIEGEVQQVVAAPFEGFIGASFARAGDTVRQGQELARLDDRDLRVEQARWRSERDQYDNKLREAMATHDLTAVQVVGAQLRQAEAQLALVGEKLARAGLKAPYDGVVVSGDLSQQIGTPVELGKKLFEIAPLQSYRVILQVDEREIRHLQPGQHGKLVVTGIAGEPMAFDVAKLTSVATAQDGRNFFRVEARLRQASPRLRPGMEGVGKVEVGQRRLWWILTHSFTDWLRITLWTWLP
ncbi:efflux RND transporter periplasmic adaptor subunit [Chitinimonas koreensis]|uniref:efflux RND transporter periplasmic adaptor subunit n=1 Tax=Chitinimonas koreensis TaxID=356302 RepID=UPI001653F897|nr:efflux RND transporter periplasmic adaptor subunit [Chitinimonas koreensis]QNM95067.1 efflux RND transporter periplasmic adaptor subunit [Chitinimonas koreensis]